MYRGTFGRGNAPCLRPLVGGTMATAPSGIAGGGSALRFGAKNAQSRWDRAFFTRRSVRGIFPAAHVAGKNDLNLSASGGNQEGTPVPSWTFLRTLDGGRRSPSNCLLLTLLPAIRLAAKRHCRRRPAAAAGRGTGAIAPRQSPQSTACFYRRNIFPQDQGSLVQRELARPKAVTEGLSGVAGHFGDDLCCDSRPFLPSAPQTLRCAPLAWVVDGTSPSPRRGRCLHRPVAAHHLWRFRRAG